VLTGGAVPGAAATAAGALATASWRATRMRNAPVAYSISLSPVSSSSFAS
jgi:hypothetical protein